MSMQGYRTRLKPVTRGDQWVFACDVKKDGAAIILDATYGAWFTIKEHKDIADAGAVIQRKSTLVGGGDTEVAFVTNPATGVVNRIKVIIPKAVTAALPNRLRTLYWDIQLLDPDSETHTLDKGTLTIEPEVTISDS